MNFQPNEQREMLFHANSNGFVPIQTAFKNENQGVIEIVVKIYSVLEMDQLDKIISSINFQGQRSYYRRFCELKSALKIQWKLEKILNKN